MSEERKDIDTLQLIYFFNAGKTDESYWTEARVFMFPPKSLLLISHAAWLSGKKEKSVSTSRIMEQEHCR